MQTRTANPLSNKLAAAARPARSGRSALVVRAASSQGGEKAKVAILGASGYTGADCVRLCHTHPGIEITALTGNSQAGQEFSTVFPHLRTAASMIVTKIEDVNFDEVDAVFCCLPHATTQATLASLPDNLKIVDLSADFRLRDVNTYAEWYGNEHAAPELQKEAVYGLTEVYREDIKNARLIANPGCYPTSIQLPLYPLLKAGMIKKDNIIIDSKSGVSGAGRGAKQQFLYTEVCEGLYSYGITRHRHAPEIEQGLTEAAGADVRVSFTPHLMPMSRGMQSTCYVELAEGQTADSLREYLAKQYENEYFVKVLPKGEAPRTQHVRGSNFNFINVFEDRIPGRAIVISVIDNVMKGASGQALQNMNLLLGYEETTGLEQLALFP